MGKPIAINVSLLFKYFGKSTENVLVCKKVDIQKNASSY